MAPHDPVVPMNLKDLVRDIPDHPKPGVNFKDITPVLSDSTALRWLVDSARKRTGKSMAEKLAGELGDASKGQGVTVKKRDDTHRMADANRAFAHYRW